jgi:rubrerythrin
MESQRHLTHSRNSTAQSNHQEETAYQQEVLESSPGTFLPVKPMRPLQTIQKKVPALSFLSTDAWKTARLSRRQIIAAGIFAATSMLLGLGNRGSWAATPYPTTIKFLQSAHVREIAMYHQYVDFGRKAKVEGYRGIAYLCAAFATAELIHAQNFAKVLARLDVEIVPVSKPQMTVRNTRDNLMKAANDEIDDIDTFYPDMIKHVNPQGVQDAITFATFAWESEKQHRDILMKIQRWAPWFFEKVAKTIDEKTDQYFVCQICGSTMDEIPPGKCPICHFSVEHYRKIEYPT